jgi:hypothetical protein
MTDLFTQSLGLVQQESATNDQVWGDILNASLIDMLDEAIGSRADIDMTGGDVTLTDLDGATDQSRPMILRFTGTPVLAATVFVPLNKQKLYVFDNTTTQIITVKTSTGIGIDVAVAEIVVAMVDGDSNNVFKMLLHPQNVVLEGATTKTLIPSTITNAGGAPAITVFSYEEGNMKTLGFFPTLFAMSGSAGAVVINPDSGEYPAPSRDQAHAIHVEEDGVGEAYIMSVFASVIFLSRADTATIGNNAAMEIFNTVSLTLGSASG